MTSYTSIIEALRSIPGVTHAGIEHTGGGNYGIECVHADWYAFLTVATVNSDGEFEIDTYLPNDPDGLYCIGLYPDADSLYDGTYPIAEAYARGTAAIVASITDMTSRMAGD
jgi:hypothetical protein